MPVEVNGLGDVFEGLDDLEDDYGDSGEDWVVGSPQEYGPVLEYGSEPHTIRPNDPDGMLRFEVDGEVVFAPKVNHPGTDPYPHWRPAVNEVRMKGAVDFIEDNSRKQGENIGSTEELIRSLAFALEGNLKKRVTRLGLIDTNAYRASIGATPLSDIGDLE